MNNYKDIYEEIIERMKSFDSKAYINIFAGDDQKKEKVPQNIHYNLYEYSIPKLKEEIDLYNVGSFGVFMNFNLLEKNHRKKENITKILYVFVDLDDAKEDDNETIKQNLESKGIYYSYNAKSGGGYHFLIPVSLKPEEETTVKGFLEYLKNNVCHKVDVATYTNERLIRCPESIHNKKGEGKQLVTLEYNCLSNQTIEDNSLKIKEYQDSAKKGIREEQYLVNIKREDIFFSTFLQDRNHWDTYIGYLKNSTNRNNIFVKNMGIFITQNPNYQTLAEDFLNNFEPTRVNHLRGWIKKAQIDKMNVNYYELLRWSKEYNLYKFQNILNQQLKHSFLDKYEFYYLEREKSDSNILLYYPDKNYYVQKSMPEILTNIYYDCKEDGVDLVKELNLEEIYSDWNEQSFKNKMKNLFDQLKRVIEKEDRIRMVYDINYRPTEEKIIFDDLTYKKYFNIYTKTSLWDYYKKQEKYHFPNVEELIRNLCGNDDKNYEWFLKWLAWIIQNPTEKLPTAVILQGRQGSGKGTLKNLILDKIFGENCLEINQTHLETQFNDYLLGKQMIVANEVMHNDNRQTLPNVLKNLVTDTELTLNMKFKKPFTCRNYTHWIFCTNNDNPIKIDEDDRRFSVFYSEKMREGLGTDIRTNIDYEIKDFVSYLKDLDVKFSEIEYPIDTQAKDEIIELNKDSVSSFKEFLSQHKSLVDVYYILYGITNYNLYMKDEETAESFIQTDIFYKMYAKYCEQYNERGVFKKSNFS
ncbi:MAG: primase-helicase family protein, partial [bacterium]